MRRSSIAASLLVLTLSAASSPVQRSHSGRNHPTSWWESLQSWNPAHLLKRNIEDADDASAKSMTLEGRDTYNCSDLKAAFDSRCWQELGLSAYLMDPETGWNHTTRVCSDLESTENNDGSDCCKVGEPWTTCYLRLAHGTPGQDCSQINSQFCSYQSDLDPMMDVSIKPQVQYVMKNIYGESTTFLSRRNTR